MRTAKHGWLIFSALLLCGFAVNAQAPRITKIDPPSWWAQHSINPVRLLIAGENLYGARLSISGAGVTLGTPAFSQNNKYILVDAHIAPDAKTGARMITATTNGGTTSFAFDIAAALPRAGRFQGFSSDDVIYLIMPDRFADGDRTNNDPAVSRGLYNRTNKFYYHGGDLQGVIDKLPYLKDLGVTALWLTPWYDNVNHPDEIEQKEGGTTTGFHGYGAVDFYGVEEHFGTPAKLRELVDKAHALGLKIIQDEVRNHTGPYHPWADDAPTPTWFNGTRANHRANVFQTWTLHDPYAEPDAYRDTLEGWFVNFLPDLNQNDPEVERYLIQNTLWWIGATGVDGIREDTWQYVPNSFWAQWTAAINREYPQFRTFGEVKDSDATHVAFFDGGQTHFDGIKTGVDSLLDFPLFYPVRDAFAKGGEVRPVAQALARDWLYTNPNLLVVPYDSHDDGRFMSEPGATIQGLKLANTFLLTTRGVPNLYYGDEIAMTGADEPTTRKDFPGGFPGDARNAFTQAGRTPEEQETFTYLKKLLELRGKSDELRRGKLINLLVTPQQYVYARCMINERTGRMTDPVIIALNNDKQPATFTFSIAPVNLTNGNSLTNLLGTSPDTTVANGSMKISLPARTAGIFVIRINL